MFIVLCAASYQKDSTAKIYCALYRVADLGKPEDIIHLNPLR